MPASWFSDVYKAQAAAVWSLSERNGIRHSNLLTARLIHRMGLPRGPPRSSNRPHHWSPAKPIPRLEGNLLVSRHRFWSDLPYISRRPARNLSRSSRQWIYTLSTMEHLAPYLSQATPAPKIWCSSPRSQLQTSSQKPQSSRHAPHYLFQRSTLHLNLLGVLIWRLLRRGCDNTCELLNNIPFQFSASRSLLLPFRLRQYDSRGHKRQNARLEFSSTR